MSNISLGAGGLLQYNRDFGVLICRGCEYAIQKSAIESHLLKHKIYRGDRQDLLGQIATLNLLEPNDVPQPRRGSLPIEALPIFTGFRCTEAGCDHLTISEKRIKRHWSEAHGLGESLPPLSAFTCQVKLQTFFRGTKLRYFEVSSLPTSTTTTTTTNGSTEHRLSTSGSTCRPSSDGLHQELPAAQSHDGGTALNDNLNGTSDLDLITMTYLHHFTTVTCRTLPGSVHYWQSCVIPQGLRHAWLMYGLLSLAARHLMVLARDLLTEQLHRDRDTWFTSQFMSGMQRRISGFENDMEPTTAEMVVQIQSFLKLSQLSAIEFPMLSNTDSSYQALHVVSIMRTCTMSSTMSRNSDLFFSDKPFETTIISERNAVDAPGNTNKIPHQLLHHLHTLPLKMAETLAKPDSAMAVFATMSAIATLVDCCDISYASDEVDAAWEGVIAWSTKISDHFHEMVTRRDTAALVVLAHWATILVKRAEQFGCWLVKGLARNIVLQTANHLSATAPGALCLLEKIIPEV